MIIWTEKKIRQIIKEELEKLLSNIHTQEEQLKKLLHRVGKDYSELKEIENLKAKKVVKKAIVKQLVKRGPGRPKQNK